MDVEYIVISLPVSGEFFHLLLIFANSSDLGQAQHNVVSDLNPN